MKTENVSNLKKAIFALLYDQYDVPDIELRDSDNTYIDYILGALIEKNENICPYKNYDCIGHCDVNNIGCADGIKVDCNRELEEIWRDFIDIENEEGMNKEKPYSDEDYTNAKKQGLVLDNWNDYTKYYELGEQN